MKGANFWLYYFVSFLFLSYRRESSAPAHIYCFLMNLWRSNEYKSNAEKVLVCDYKAFLNVMKTTVTSQCGKHGLSFFFFFFLRKTNRSHSSFDYLWGQSFGKMNWALSNHLKGKRFAELNYCIWMVLIDFSFETHKIVK